MTNNVKLFDAAAYGGEGWSPRSTTLKEELGNVWGACGMSSDYKRLKAVLLHRPGDELVTSANPNDVLMFEQLDLVRAQTQHDDLAEAYRQAGAAVYYVEPGERPLKLATSAATQRSVLPNQMFCADLMFMTPEGAIIARPASTVRAGEERWVARRLAELGIPIVRSVGGNGTFEGADAMWLDPQTVLIGRGLRTNDEGAAQVTTTLNEMGVSVIQVDLPFGTMHLMGILRIVDHDLACARATRLVHRGVEALKTRGYQVEFVPDGWETDHNNAFNFVTLGPREILMAAGNPITQAFYENLGVKCHPVACDELGKAAGSIGCLSGILQRE